MWTYLKLTAQFYHLSPTNSDKQQNYMQSLQQHKPTVHIPNSLKKIVTKSSAWLCKLQYDPLLLKTGGQDISSEHWYVRCISTSSQTCAQDVLMFALKKCGRKFSVTKMKSKCQNQMENKTKHLWVTDINNLTYCNTLLKENNAKQNKWCTPLTYNHQHIDINTWAKGNLANTQQLRITVILVQQKFTASFCLELLLFCSF